MTRLGAAESHCAWKVARRGSLHPAGLPATRAVVQQEATCAEEAGPCLQGRGRGWPWLWASRRPPANSALQVSGGSRPVALPQRWGNEAALQEPRGAASPGAWPSAETRHNKGHKANKWDFTADSLRSFCAAPECLVPHALGYDHVEQASRGTGACFLLAEGPEADSALLFNGLLLNGSGP